MLKYAKDECESALLKVDGLFFDKVYADLMCILKSKELNKKFLDMKPTLPSATQLP